MSAADRLNEIEARANAATKGPWHTQPLSPHRPADTYDVEATGRGEMVVANLLHGDAEFIAHARSDVPALVAALRDVLELHKPYCPFGDDVPYCGQCEGDQFVRYPCQTVEAITEALNHG